jgi:hypothetical protein
MLNGCWSPFSLFESLLQTLFEFGEDTFGHIDWAKSLVQEVNDSMNYQ